MDMIYIYFRNFFSLSSRVIAWWYETTAACSSLVTISPYTTNYVTVTLMYVAYHWQRKVSVLLI